MAINRRDVILGAIGTGTALVGAHALGAGLLSPTVARAQTGGLEESLVIRTTGGVFEQALRDNFFDPFTEATGVKVIPVQASYGDMMAKSAAMQAAGQVEWDIISPQYYELSKLGNLLEDLGDCSAMPNVASQGIPDACGGHGVLYLTGGQVLTFDPQTFTDKKPQTWADFWDVEAFPGPRALPNTGSPWATLIAALIADGVAPADLFPLDLDRAFAKLDEIKPHVAVWWTTGAQSQQVMRQGEAVMTLMWSGTAYATREAGVPLEWSWSNAVADFGAFGILKGAPHPNAARAFIDFYMGHPENHAAFSRQMGYATSSQAGRDLLTDEEKTTLGAVPEVADQIITPDADWLEKNRAAALERWNAWISA
ncbi:MAG: ABC transporter substrate-binding protein [Rhizobiaceae bacterium]|nr:ABC transporter substrate-binding protein [Rhizobiaceae bacterium]